MSSFNSSRMRGQVYGFLDLLLPSIQNTQKPHKSLISLLLFTRSLSCSLNVVEPYETTSDFAVNKTKDRAVQFHQGFDKSSSKNLSPDRAKSRLLSDSNVRSKPVKLGSKERLRKYSSLLRNCATKGSLNEGRLIHGHVIKGGLELDSHLWVSLINAYAKCGSIVYARRVLDVMPKRDVVSWTALISGFVAEGYGSDGVNLFNEMRKECVRPNEFALATALKACSMCWDLDFGKQDHVEAMKLGFSLDLFVGSALVDLYEKCGEMGLADRVFCGMPVQNAVSWNALLNGYAERGDGKKVMDLFCSLKDPEMKFSKFTLSPVTSKKIHTRRLIEAQMRVLRTAREESKLAAKGSSPLKPVQPIQRIPAPASASGRLSGGKFPWSSCNLGPTTYKRNRACQFMLMKESCPLPGTKKEASPSKLL